MVELSCGEVIGLCGEEVTITGHQTPVSSNTQHGGGGKKVSFDVGEEYPSKGLKRREETWRRTW